MNSETLRRVNLGRKSDTAQARYTIYKAIWARISDANEQRFWLECVTLCESILADRLEALWSQLHHHDVKARTVRTAKQNAKSLLNRKDLTRELYELCESICAWSDKRNRAVHEMAKLLEGDDRTIEQKFEDLEHTSSEGIALARKASKLIALVNKRMAIARVKA